MLQQDVGGVVRLVGVVLLRCAPPSFYLASPRNYR